MNRPTPDFYPLPPPNPFPIAPPRAARRYLGGPPRHQPKGSKPFRRIPFGRWRGRSEEHTSELQSRPHLVCRLLLEKKNESCLAKSTMKLRLWSLQAASLSVPT